jgi:RNA polymerase sigma-70 factor (ECF subfamily)
MSSSSVSRTNLILAAKRDGDDALGRLLELYRNYLSLLARLEVGGRLQRKLDPSDLVQETFLDAHRYFGNFVGTTESQLTTWLRTILAAKAADTARRYLGTQARDLRFEQNLTESFERSSHRLAELVVAAGASPSQQVAHREQAVVLADALAQLADDYREVIVLRHWDGLTFPDIARRMERSLDSVEKLWMRAIMRLRSVVGEQT